MQILSQNDPRWKNIKLGTSNVTIGGYGCTITSLAMILGTTPDVVNEKLKSVGGFAPNDKNNPDTTKNLVIWAKIPEAFPGTQVRRVYSYNNDDVKANVPNVLVEVDGKPIGGYRHWVVYVGGGKQYDPWDGKEGPTSEYPNPVSYCVVIPPVVTAPISSTAEHDRDINWNLVVFLCGLLNVEVNADDKEATKKRAGEAISELQVKAGQVSTLQKQALNKDLERDEALKQAKTEYENQFRLDKESWETERTRLSRIIGQQKRRLDERIPKTITGRFKFILGI